VLAFQDADAIHQWPVTRGDNGDWGTEGAQAGDELKHSKIRTIAVGRGLTDAI